MNNLTFLTGYLRNQTYSAVFVCTNVSIYDAYVHVYVTCTCIPYTIIHDQSCQWIWNVVNKHIQKEYGAVYINYYVSSSEVHNLVIHVL